MARFKVVLNILFGAILLFGTSPLFLENLFSTSKTLRIIAYVCLIISVIFILGQAIEKQIKFRK